MRFTFFSKLALLFVFSHSFLFAGENMKPGGKLDFRLTGIPLLPDANGVKARIADPAARLATLRENWGRMMASSKNANRVRVTIDADVNDALLARIRATGAEILNVSERWKSIGVEATLEQVDALGQFDEIRSVKLALKPWRKAGPVTSQGDNDLRANAVRALGITGGGQRVGVLSDTVNRTPGVGAGTLTPSGNVQILTGTNPQIAGELPAQIIVVDPGPAPSSGDSDEGEGMLEIVHDLAPGADLAFASAFSDQATFAENIRKLRTLAGSTVITDDIQYFAEPMFQDGPIAQAIAENFASGVPHFAAAGNNGNEGVQAVFADVNPSAADPRTGGLPTTRADFHNWGFGGATPELLPVVVNPGGSFIVVLQWDQPYQSFGLGQGAQMDMDLYIYNTGFQIITGSADLQGAPSQPRGDPVEIAGVNTNQSGSPITYLIGVDRFNGTNANFRIVFFSSGSVTYPSGTVTGPSLYGHATATQCFAVGAVPHNVVDATGPVGAPESFTSKGGIGSNGLPIFFNTVGAPSFTRRDKPDIAAIDGANTSLFGTDDGTDVDNFPNFYGTSAAAPHAAAVAALLKSRATMTPSQLIQVMRDTARDVTASPAAAGADDRTGAGLIDALAAIQALPTITTQPSSQSVNEGTTATFSIAATGSSLTFQWRKNGQNIPGATSTSYTTPATVFLNDNNASFTCVVGGPYATLTSNTASLTVLSKPQILTPPVNAIVNVGQTASFFVVAVGSGSIQYQWKRNGQIINGAVTPTLNVPNAQTSDDNAEFTCDMTNNVGTTTTVAVKLIINTAPQISSAPILNPSPAMTGQTVSCTVAATDPQPHALSVSWTFGDGGTGTGATTTYVYSVAGTYNGKVRVTDPLGLFAEASFTITIILDTDRDQIPDTEDLDDDGDGINDKLELEVGTSPLDRTSTPFGDKAASGTSELPATKLAIKLSFKAPLKDSLSLSGTVAIPEGFAPFNQRVTVSVGGVAQSFDLDAKGKSFKIPQGSFKVSFKASKGVVAAQTGKYSMKLSKLTFSEKLADENLIDVTTPVKKEARTVNITLFFAQQILQQTKTIFYTAKTGSGSAK